MRRISRRGCGLQTLAQVIAVDQRRCAGLDSVQTTGDSLVPRVGSIGIGRRVEALYEVMRPLCALGIR